MSAMAQYGYSLLQPDRMEDPNDLLASLAQSRDSRVLEGFPVVLANALAKHGGKVDLAAAESGLVGQATDVCYFQQGRLLVHAAPTALLAGFHWMDVCVAGAADAFATELASDGIELRGGPACFVAIVPTTPPSAERTDPTAASRILAAAARAKAPVLRCIPVV